jgi:hypothetical protein
MIGCNTEKTIYTLTTENFGGEDIFLCIDDGKTSKPIAKFMDVADVQLFHSVLNKKWQVAQTQGRMGI